MNLQLITQDKFDDILVDVYRNDNDDVFMTSRQLGKALEYSNPAIAINNLVSPHYFDNRFTQLLERLRE